MSLATEGTFKCEVSADSPTFATVSAERQLKVYGKFGRLGKLCKERKWQFELAKLTVEAPLAIAYSFAQTKALHSGQ